MRENGAVLYNILNGLAQMPCVFAELVLEKQVALPLGHQLSSMELLH